MKKEKTQQTYVEPEGFNGTTGEWYQRIDHQPPGGYVISSMVDKEYPIVCVLKYEWEYHGIEANAKLISKSKELAKALQDMTQIIKRLDTWHHLENGVFTYTDPNRDGDQLTIDLQESLAKSTKVLKDAGLK